MTTSNNNITRIDILVITLDPLSTNSRFQRHTIKFRHTRRDFTSRKINRLIMRLSKITSDFFHDIARTISSTLKSNITYTTETKRPELSKSFRSINNCSRISGGMLFSVRKKTIKQKSMIMRTREIFAILTAHIKSNTIMGFPQTLHKILKMLVIQTIIFR